jgi:hypothetical protein
MNVRLLNAVHQLRVSLERDSILSYACAFYQWQTVTKERQILRATGELGNMTSHVRVREA